MHIYAGCTDVSTALTVSNLFQEMKKLTLLATGDSPDSDKWNACRISTTAFFFSFLFFCFGRHEAIYSCHPLSFWRLWATNVIPWVFNFFPNNAMVTGIVYTKVMDTDVWFRTRRCVYPLLLTLPARPSSFPRKGL